MNKKEISELKKQFTPDNCTISRICGCYVDSEKEKRLEMSAGRGSGAVRGRPALIGPAVLTAILAPVTLWLHLRREWLPRASPSGAERRGVA